MIAFAALRTRADLETAQSFSSSEGSGPASKPAFFAAEMVLNCLEHAVLIVDQRGQVHFASAATEQFFARGRLCVRSGQLYASAESESLAIRCLVARLASPVGQKPAIFHRLGMAQDSLHFVVIKAPTAALAAEQQFYAVFVTDPRHAPLPHPDQLREQFGLTASESALAVEIVKGHGLKSCARHLGVALTTARSHLRAIFEKTNTKRQAELARLISVLCVAVRPPMISFESCSRSKSANQTTAFERNSRKIVD